jgi:hypothetical protein
MGLKQWGVALLAAMLLAGCATVTIRPEGGTKVTGKPDYQKSENYFFWGLGGEHTIDVAEICEGKGVEQMQSQQTFMNGFLTAITLGIYAPKSAKVWCKEGADQ